MRGAIALTALLSVTTLLSVACGASQSPSERSVEGCVGGTQAAQSECVARGCAYGPESWCAGVAPPEEWEDAQQRGQLACACTCQADIERCSMLP